MSDLCIFCGRSEDIAHSLLTCHFAREVWRLIKQVLNFKHGRGEFMSIKTWLFSFLSQATKVEATVLAVVVFLGTFGRLGMMQGIILPLPHRVRLVQKA
jgi:hypothetical protein